MHLISSVLFAFSANIDTFVVGMSYGIQKTHISFLQKVLISMITLAGTFLSISMGIHLLPFLPPQAAQIAGSTLLIVLGIYYLIKSIVKSFRERVTSCQAGPSSAAQDWLSLSMKEAVIIGLALSINNIGMGIGVSVTGVGLLFTSGVTFFISMAFLYLGNNLGKTRLFRLTSQFADPLSGLILIGLGIYELLI